MKFFLVVLLVSLFRLQANAEVAYTTLGTNDSFNASGSDVIGGASRQAIAESFEPSVTGTLNAIDLAVGLGGLPTTFTLRLYANNPTGGPLTTLALATGDITPPSNPALVTFSYSGLPLELVSGQTYWVALSPDSTTSGGWNLSNITTNSQTFASYAGQESYRSVDATPAAFMVDVTVPEPSTYAMMLGGLVLLGFCMRRKLA